MSTIQDILADQTELGLEGRHHEEFTGNAIDLHESMEAIAGEVDVAYSATINAGVASDTLIGSFESLSGLLEELESSNEALTPQGAKFAGKMVDQAVSPFNGVFGNPVPSMECFANETEAEANTTVSVEGLKDTLKSIWQSIKNVVIRAVEAVKNFFSKVFQGWEKIEARANAAKSANHSGKTDEVKVKFISAMAFKGGIKPSDIVNGSKALKEATAKIDKSATDLAAGYVGMVSGLKEIEKDNKSGFLDKVKDFFGAQKDAATTHNQQNLPGGYVITTEKEAEAAGGNGGDADAAVDEALKLLSSPPAPKVVSSKKYKKVDESRMIGRLSESDVNGLMDTVLAIAGDSKKRKDAIDKINTARKDTVTAMDAIIKLADENVFKSGWNKVKVRRLASSVKRDAAKFINDVERIAFVACRGYVAYAETSNA